MTEYVVFLQEEGDDDVWRSPLAVRLAVIFVYTQFVCNYLIPGDSHGLFGVSLEFLQQASVGRVLQIVLMGGLYMYHLESQSEWT